MTENEIIEQLRQDGTRLFDRLADRELSPFEQRVLLAALDDEPGGWRRCALALLESQALRGDLASFGVPSREPIAPLVASRPRALPFGARLAAIAATVVVAFVVGWSLGNRGTTESVGTDASMLATVNDAALATPEATSTAQWETVKIRAGDGQEIELPVVDAATGYDEWLEQQGSQQSAEIIKKLEAAGNRVTRTRKIWPMTLPDGRQVIVPVDQIEVQPDESATETPWS